MSRIMLRRRVPEPQKLRATGFFAVLMALMLVLAGCGGDESQPSADGKIELTVWASRSYYVPPDEFKSFMADHPNIVVKWDVKDSDDILQQMQRMKDAGQKLPDVIQEESQLVQAFLQSGLIIPLDEQLERWKTEDADLYDKILPQTWDETRIDGKATGMSITANFDVLYYNSQWVKDAGVTLPAKTYDELFADAEKMKAVHPDKAAFAVQALAGEGVTTLLNFMIGSGVPFTGATPDLQSPQAQYVIDWFKRAQAAGLLPKEAISWGEAETRGAFVAGDGGLLVDGFTTAGDFNEVGGFEYPENWSNALLPAATGTGGFTGSSPASARTWMISSGTEHPYEASLILRYIADTPNLVGQATHGGVPMRQTEALNDPALLEAWPFFTEELKQAFINGTPRPAALNSGEVEDVLEQMFGEIVTGTDQSAKQLADKYQPQLDALAS
jgi:ABC-type glycerol-3-phosphate transport system substrate-binding protein